MKGQEKRGEGRRGGEERRGKERRGGERRGEERRERPGQRQELLGNWYGCLRGCQVPATKATSAACQRTLDLKAGPRSRGGTQTQSFQYWK